MCLKNKGGNKNYKKSSSKKNCLNELGIGGIILVSLEEDLLDKRAHQ